MFCSFQLNADNKIEQFSEKDVKVNLFLHISIHVCILSKGIEQPYSEIGDNNFKCAL